MRGLTLRVTNPTATRANLTDIVGVSGVAPGETIEVLYTNDVQQSLEFGTLNTYLTSGGLTATFVSGSVLSRAPMGSTLVGATPTTDGVRGLVPRPAIADRDRYLKGDGTWYGVTALTIGAVPEAKLTTQGDLLFRGVTTSERLPLGTLGQVLRAGLVNPQWQDNTYVGTFAGRPLPDATYAGSFYWATDSHTLYICYYNGTSWVWSPLSAGGFSWAGEWDSLVAYTANQAVRRLGNAYVSLTSNTNSPPESNPTDWSPMTDVGAGWDTFPTGSVPGFGADITHVGRAAVGVDPSSSIPVGIQFRVLGSSLYDNTFFRQVSAVADQPSSTQVRANSTDGGLYSKPNGLPERRMDLPGLTRKAIPNSETVIIPNGSQYIAVDSFTLGAGASLVLQGDASLEVLTNTSLSFLTVNGDMVFRDAAGVVTRLPVGTPGQYLTAQTSGLSVVPTWTDFDIPDLDQRLADLSGVFSARNSYHLIEASGAYHDKGTAPQGLTDHGAARRARFGPRSLLPGLWPDAGATTGLSFPATVALDKSFTVAVTVIGTTETFAGGYLLGCLSADPGKYLVVTLTPTTVTIRSQNGLTTVPVTTANDLTKPTRILAIHTATSFTLFLNGAKIGPIGYANDVDVNAIWLFSSFGPAITNAGFAVNDLDFWDSALSDSAAAHDYERYAQTFVATKVPSLSYSETTLASNAAVDGSTLNAWFTVGSRRVDPANYINATLEFCAEGTVSGGGLTGDVRLYDATAAAVITTFGFANTSPTDPSASQRAAIPSPSVTSQWLVQIRVTATGLPSDSFNLTAAFVAVTAS